MKPVFIHISKNAGSSIIRTAGDAIIVAGHCTAARWIADNGRPGPLFAVVRNPFDRVVSDYFFRRRRVESGDRNPHLANLGKSFDEWVVATYRHGEFRSRAFFESRAIPYIEGNMVGDTLIWFLPQVRWIGGARGEILVDELLRYERLESDWRRFAAKHGIDARLTHDNASPRELDYRHYYSSRSRDVVRSYYREDLETFGYTFD